jgi:predicted transcriptional regulator
MYNAPILKKAIDIIKLMVRENKPLGVTEIARELSISKSTTFGILRSLEQKIHPGKWAVRAVKEGAAHHRFESDGPAFLGRAGQSCR